MPNWCENRVEIFHDEKIIKKIQEELREDWTEEVDGEIKQEQHGSVSRSYELCQKRFVIQNHLTEFLLHKKNVMSIWKNIIITL